MGKYIGFRYPNAIYEYRGDIDKIATCCLAFLSGGSGNTTPCNRLEDGAAVAGDWSTVRCQATIPNSSLSICAAVTFRSKPKPLEKDEIIYRVASKEKNQSGPF